MGQNTGFAHCVVNAWDMRDHNPLWNWIQVSATFTDCQHQGMEGAYMVMTTWFRYWTSPPTILTNPDWTAQLYNTSYKVTRVEP